MPYPVPRPPGANPTTAGPLAKRQPKETITRHTALSRIAVAVPLALVLLVLFALPAGAAGGAASLSGLIDNLRTWLVGLLAGVATLFLTIGGLRYLTAGGDPGQVEKAKSALKSAAIGYALAALSPLVVSILASLVK